MTNLDSVLESRDVTLPTKVRRVKVNGFFSSHVWMWELDHKEGWALTNWCFWTVELEKILESLGRQGDQTTELPGKSLQIYYKLINKWIYGRKLNGSPPFSWFTPFHHQESTELQLCLVFLFPGKMSDQETRHWLFWVEAGVKSRHDIQLIVGSKFAERQRISLY